MAGRPKELTPKDMFELRLMREAGVSIIDCAAYFRISKATVFRVLAQLRAKCGPEKLKRKQSARAYLYTSQNSPATQQTHDNIERSRT